ncbi:MAG: hypothetical protein JW896_17985 [Deltaproteobacteria bacterium]|nr:hypothetical protein [Deltaproteobacteria bacterium]
MGHHSIQHFVSFLIFIIIASSCAHTGNRINADIINSGTIYEEDIGEASGIALSQFHENVIWVINDSGNSASVYALNPRGRLLCTLNIENVWNNDWEDLASFEYEGKPYILIADVGDNHANRKACFLHFIEEPDIDKTSNLFSLSVKPSWSITYTYEDGPRDCEAVAVDMVNEKILLLSKRDHPPILYELPLTRQKNAVARKCAEIKPLPQRTQDDTELSKYSNLPTAMDISSDGLSAVVLTYDCAFYFRKNESSNWATVFSGSWKEIVFPPLRQAESVCFTRDGSSIFITSEQLPAPLLKIDISQSVGMNDR